MNKVLFNNAKFDRASVPDELRDLSSWPTVDISALNLDKALTFRARQRALELFVLEPERSMRSIQTATGVDPKTIYRMFARCIEKHPDGRIFGFRAIIPYARLKEYERVFPISAAHGDQGTGLAGVFNWLLQRYPPLAKFLESQAKQRHKSIQGPVEVRRKMKHIHRAFLVKCREVGIKPNEYPLNQALSGLRSLAEWLRRYDDRTFESAATSRGARRVRPPAPEDMNQSPPATRAFEVVEFDGHKIDLRVSLRITDPLGFQHLVELTRIWILVLLDVASRAVIGYKLALSKEYNKDDVAAAFQAALTPFRPMTYKIPGLTIREGGGFPSSVFPAAQYACWEWLRFDGAKAHLAADTLMRLNQIVGCWPDNGRAGDPNERPFIERFFALIAENFAHRLPGTTGSNPESIERALSDPNGDLSLLVELSELEEMIEVTVADYNGQSHDGISSRTPLEAMGQLLARHPGFVRTLPAVVRENLCLLQEAKVVPVHGSTRNSVRPHINFLGVRYTNNVLSSSPNLIGSRLRIYFDVRDIRTVKAFFDDGAELGVLSAAHPWCYTPHSLRVRREIARLKRTGKLKYRDGDDPVEAWEKMKAAEAKTKKRSATALAKAHTDARDLQPKAPQPFAAPAAANTVPATLVAPTAPDLSAPLARHGGQTEGTQTCESAPASAPQPKELRIKRIITF
jgi:hypothetical protein